ncbi:MAG: PD-(D/E)XK nuclease-like domain-containing protein [Sphingobacteriaceae bacterium]|nr:PD-(D/E)XK nuclease-like domain-containing protein [Sphingobacteriaceae bacterium]
MNFDLSNAEIEDFEMNPLDYNPADYPTASDVIEGILTRQADAPVSLTPKELSVNGRVAADKMEKYLASKSNSSSALKQVLKNPASYFFYMNDRENFKEKEKSHFELGTFCHQAFLEPHLFDLVVVEPEANRASIEGCNEMVSFWENLIFSKYKYQGVADKKLNEAMEHVDAAKLDVKKLAGMKYYIDCLKEVSGHTAIKSQHKAIIDVIKRNYYMYGGGIIPMILKGAQVEHSFYGKDPSTGIDVRVRPDAFNIAENIGVNAVISFKTTSAEDMGKFVYDSAKYKYELSEGMYQEVMSEVTGRNFNVTIMVVLQTVAPFLPAVFIWSGENLANGKYKYHYALDTIAECKRTGLYPGFESLAESGNYGIIELNQPEWAAKLLQPIDLED